ncbi:HicA-like toxin [Streptomyces phage Mischief19]|nr:HicA-like toxin [Streptomyces phage Mischief19]
MASQKKEAAEIIRRCERDYGCSVKLNGKGHYVITRPGAPRPAYVPATPSGARSLANVKAEIKRYLGIRL